MVGVFRKKKGRDGVRRWVRQSDSQVWSRQVEVSRGGEEMPRARRFPPGVSMLQAQDQVFMESGQALGGQ